ncbi:GNAT family N-acetyltransferase [Butyrivibrio sp. WCE2006]|uniref:GNAT family N-acetyltransferase n=1 Tax=Butyrivibrio sp. WCE2006 TaxID=1410611 RepID=UPI0005D2C12C|nr:GNAT family N-acetyltransferase [Butyrivibrio sp. WCE2006]
MNFRRANEKDIPQIHELLRQVNLVHHIGRPDLFKKANKYTDEEIAGILKDDTRPIFAAADDTDTMLGYAFCVHQEHPEDDNLLTPIKTLYIDDLCVDENARGQHVGKSLYEYVINWAKEQGYYNVTLNVWTCNESAMKFYESVGMTPYKIGMEQILSE